MILSSVVLDVVHAKKMEDGSFRVRAKTLKRHRFDENEVTFTDDFLSAKSEVAIGVGRHRCQVEVGSYNDKVWIKILNIISKKEV